jgi:hypothetical protein
VRPLTLTNFVGAMFSGLGKQLLYAASGDPQDQARSPPVRRARGEHPVQAMQPYLTASADRRVIAQRDVRPPPDSKTAETLVHLRDKGLARPQTFKVPGTGRDEASGRTSLGDHPMDACRRQAVRPGWLAINGGQDPGDRPSRTGSQGPHPRMMAQMLEITDRGERPKLSKIIHPSNRPVITT